MRDTCQAVRRSQALELYAYMRILVAQAECPSGRPRTPQSGCAPVILLQLNWLEASSLCVIAWLPATGYFSMQGGYQIRPDADWAQHSLARLLVDRLQKVLLTKLPDLHAALHLVSEECLLILPASHVEIAITSPDRTSPSVA